MPGRTVLVVGATGAQGGGVARRLLRGGRFTVRCLTRNPQSEKAATLEAAGAEVVQGDLDDPASLRAALKGCWGAFGVTNFREHFVNEATEGRNLIDAVADARLDHFIFSTLPHARKISGGRLEVPHFDIKAQLQEYAVARKLPATFIHVAFYYENFLSPSPPRRQADGTFVLGFPQGDTPLAAVSVEDVGGVVAALFADPGQWLGKTVGVVGDDRPPAEYAAIMSQVTGKRIVYNYVPRDTYARFDFTGAEDLADMFEFNRLYIPNRAADLALSRQLHPQMQTFEVWAKQNRARLDQVLSAQPAPAAQPRIDRPQDMHRVFAQAFNSHDLPGLLSIYEPAAKLVTASGGEVVGREAIRSDLEQILATGGTMQAQTTSVIEGDEVAVTRGHWKLEGTGPDGKPLNVEAASVEVLRRQADGSWLVAIDCPFAGA